MVRVAGPDPTLLAPSGAVCAVDTLASSAGVAVLRAGGSAADAAVATSAVLAVTTQHMCGMGGDLVAVVDPGAGADPAALLAVGGAGAGTDPEAMRREGHRSMPHRDDIRTVTVPGCVDGWLALHARYGRLPLTEVLEPARRYAEMGFPVSPLLAASLPRVAGVAGGQDLVGELPVHAGDRRRRPAMGRAIAAVAANGRDGWYGGGFGAGLVRLGAGLFDGSDLDHDLAVWEQPLAVDALGWQLLTTGAPTAGYLALAGAAVAERLGLPDDADDPLWAHLLIEACRAVGHDRPEQLHEHADLAALLTGPALDARAALVDPGSSLALDVPGTPGGTIHLSVADADGMVVSVSQSNAGGFGAHLAVPEVGVFLQNRGLGFSLEPGHPAELGPGRRPPHTLAPLVARGLPGGRWAGTSTSVGTMGGDAQPQIVVQLLARLAAGASPAAAVTGPRFGLAGPDGSGFDTWDGVPATPGQQPRYPSLVGQTVRLEDTAPAGWKQDLQDRGHRVTLEPVSGGFGHATVLQRRADGTLAGSADPRAGTSAAVGF